MDARYAVQHARALELAQRALKVGARLSTVELLTGLNRGTLRRYFSFDAEDAPRPGKRPSSPERFVKNATLTTMVDASVAYAIYRDHRKWCPYPAEALLAAYRLYTDQRAPPRLSFDRVFYIVCWVDRLWAWAAQDSVFRFATCSRCHCRYLAPVTSVVNHARDCSFCKLMERYGRNRALQDRFPRRTYASMAESIARVPPSMSANAATLRAGSAASVLDQPQSADEERNPHG